MTEAYPSNQNEPDSAMPQSAPGQSRPAITVILNNGSGADAKDEIRQLVEETIVNAGRTVVFRPLATGEDFSAVCDEAARHAQQTGGILVAAGGDGTVNTVATACLRHDVPLGVIPLGTFNFFSREFGIPADPVEAARVLLYGEVRSVNVGDVNGRLFLNNASFGLYTRIIRQREEDKSRFGRFRLVALLSAIVTLLRGQKPFAIKIALDGLEQVRRTSMVFVGNNRLQLDELDLKVARCPREDKLAVVLMKPVGRFAMAGLLLRGALRDLNDDARLDMFCAGEFSVDSKRHRVEVVIDGEVIHCGIPLVFRMLPGGLKVIVPMAEIDR